MCKNNTLLNITPLQCVKCDNKHLLRCHRRSQRPGERQKGSMGTKEKTKHGGWCRHGQQGQETQTITEQVLTITTIYIYIYIYIIISKFAFMIEVTIKISGLGSG